MRLESQNEMNKFFTFYFGFRSKNKYTRKACLVKAKPSQKSIIITNFKNHKNPDTNNLQKGIAADVLKQILTKNSLKIAKKIKCLVNYKGNKYVNPSQVIIERDFAKLASKKLQNHSYVRKYQITRLIK
jgi:TolB-like protein